MGTSQCPDTLMSCCPRAPMSPCLVCLTSQSLSGEGSSENNAPLFAARVFACAVTLCSGQPSGTHLLRGKHEALQECGRLKSRGFADSPRISAGCAIVPGQGQEPPCLAGAPAQGNAAVSPRSVKGSSARRALSQYPLKLALPI